MKGTEDCLKILSFIFQFIVFICGVIMLALGIWGAVDDRLQSLIDDVMFSGIYVMIAAGCFIMLLSFLGCWACHARSKPGVVVYSILALIAIALKVIGCIIIFNFFLDAHNALVTSYKDRYGNHSLITEMWDKIQIEGECCGLLNYWDWENSTFYAKMESKYPHSCCIRRDGQPIHLDHCQLGRKGFIYYNGCEYVLERYYYGIGGTAVGLIILELLAVIVIACLYQFFP